MSITIRSLSATKSLVLDEEYTYEDVVEKISDAIASGKSAVMFDGKRGETFVVSVGGSEPFTIREQSGSTGGAFAV